MNKIIQDLEQEEKDKKQIPNIEPADTVAVHQKISEGGKERIQIFEGVVIAKQNGGLTRSRITVRKMSGNTAVEKVFPLYSPLNVEFKVKRKGHVRRAKLYYLRDLQGKKARIKERRVTNK